MKKHNGMRPQDPVILLKIAALGSTPWLMKDLASSLGISQSEITESLNRSVFAGLIAPDKKTLMKQALLEFLDNGLRYVFPQHPGPLVRGVPTAYSAEPLNEVIMASEPVVWPYAEGKVRGQAITPLHPAVPAACLKDPRLYHLLSLTDALRVGRSRERKLAMMELKQRLP